MSFLVHIPLAMLVLLAGGALAHWMGAPRRAALWSGWFAANAVCLMREITQAEYRWIEAFGSGRRANMPALEGLAIWMWNAHSLLETLGALSTTTALVLLLGRRR